MKVQKSALCVHWSQLIHRIHQKIEHLRNQADYVLLRVKVGVQSAFAEQKASGSVTAEYAVILIAATGFAGVLALILKSPEVKSQLTALITRGLKAA